LAKGKEKISSFRSIFQKGNKSLEKGNKIILTRLAPSMSSTSAVGGSSSAAKGKGKLRAPVARREVNDLKLLFILNQINLNNY